jgi:hypothetical protein
MYANFKKTIAPHELIFMILPPAMAYGLNNVAHLISCYFKVLDLVMYSEYHLHYSFLLFYALPVKLDASVVSHL